jgi:hypothetical protein
MLALIPFPSLTAPDWRITVIDEAHKSVKGALVRESYTNYSIEAERHESDAFTDGSGIVSFPARRIHGSVLRRLFGTLRAAMGGVHASFGPSAYVNAVWNCGRRYLGKGRICRILAWLTCSPGVYDRASSDERAKLK